MNTEFRNNESSPEENLLKHIRQQNSEKDNIPGGPKGDSRKAKKASGPTGAGKKRNWLSALNRLLILAIAVLMGLSAYEIFLNKKEVSKLEIKKVSPRLPIEEEKEEPETKPYSLYQKDFLKRDIFESVIYRSNDKGTTISSSAPELTKKLKLVGILLSDDSEAIIEDLETKQTLFLYKGEQVKDATIEDIEESKVLLRYKDQLIELVQ